MARSRQIEIGFRSHGGKRDGAGRKPGANPGVTHARRPAITTQKPVHVTLRVRAHVYNLRSKRCFSVIEGAFAQGHERFGFRLVHFAVLGNHVHLLVEADDAAALARGMKGLSVRLARGLNRVMGRCGSVFADRYHARVLASPREVRHVLAYLFGNARHHYGSRGPAHDPYCSSAQPSASPVTAKPHGWLLRGGWRRAGPLEMG